MSKTALRRGEFNRVDTGLPAACLWGLRTGLYVFLLTCTNVDPGLDLAGLCRELEAQTWTRR